MNQDVIPVVVKAVVPAASGCAVFIGDEAKTFVIYVDHSVGNAIQMCLQGVKKDRPLTHDLIAHILTGLDVKVEHVVINEVQGNTYYARILLRMENELGLKIVEIDARPSDSIVIAIQQGRPLLVARAVFEAVEDATEILERLIHQQQRPEEAGESDPDEPSDDEDDDEDESK